MARARRGGGWRIHQSAPAPGGAGSRWSPRVLAQGEAYGRSNRAQRRARASWNSSRPIPPGRCTSDTAARPRSATRSRACSSGSGSDVSREFYYNDAGQQIQNLARVGAQRARTRTSANPCEFPSRWLSRRIHPRAGRSAISTQVGRTDRSDDRADPPLRRRRAAQRSRTRDLDAFGVRFDHYYLESFALHRRARRRHGARAGREPA